MNQNTNKSGEAALGDPVSQLFARGLKDREIAIICDVSPNAVNRWRHNKNGVSKYREKAAEAYLHGLLMAESKTADQREEQEKVRKSIDDDLEKLERLRTHTEPDLPTKTDGERGLAAFRTPTHRTHRFGSPEGGVDISFLVMVAPDQLAKFEKVMSMFHFEFVDFDIGTST